MHFLISKSVLSITFEINVINIIVIILLISFLQEKSTKIDFIIHFLGKDRMSPVIFREADKIKALLSEFRSLILLQENTSKYPQLTLTLKSLKALSLGF